MKPKSGLSAGKRQAVALEHDETAEREERAAPAQEEKAAAKLAGNKVASILEAKLVFRGMTWAWFTFSSSWQPKEVGSYYVSEYYPDLNIAVDKFSDCETAAQCEQYKHVAEKKKLLAAHGIKYAYLYRGNSLADLEPQLAEA